jgi:hypothetical protein
VALAVGEGGVGARLLTARAPVYAEADLTVDSGDGPANDAVKTICAALGYA